MAAPNIVNVSTITGKTVSANVLSTATEIVSNAASSGKVFKINNIIAANIDGTSAADITVSIYSQDDLGGGASAVASTISVPADATLVVLDKNTALYLEEDKSIGAVASANGDITITCSYEEIS